MPIYVYKNLNTGQTFELQQPITADALTHDPQTGDPVKRIVQPVGIAFKGSGFYVNDSKSKSKTSTPPSASVNTGSDTAAPAASTSTTSESAPKAATPAPAASSSSD